VASVPDLAAYDNSEKYITGEGPAIRLLFCKNCKTLEELPDFEGQRPEDDVLLQILTERHVSAGVPHTGQLMRVSLQFWAVPSIKEEITRQIFQNGAPGLASLMPDFYETKATFSEDAMTCWRQHLSPKDSCPDYGSEKKRLLPDTRAERKDLGLAPAAEDGPRVYLCQFCPVHAMVVQKQRAARGDYDK
jgi:hypothetical protein